MSVASNGRQNGESSRALTQALTQGDLILSMPVFGTGGGRPLTMHLLRPAVAPAEPAPVLVWVHGGGWRGGHKDSGIMRLLPFARRGYVCASVEYRLSGEAIFPAQIEDCKCAIRYLRAHAAQYHLDPHRIGAWGSSAGGHLVALLGTAPDVPALEGTGGWSDQSSRVQAVCDWYGPTDLLQMTRFPSRMDHSAADSPGGMLLGGPVAQHPDRVAAANPISYVTGDEPPFMILHGDADDVVPLNQSVLLNSALIGSDVTFHTVNGGGHGGTTYDHPAILGLVADFFDKHLQAPITARETRNGHRADDASAPTVVSGASRSWVNPDTAPPGTVYRTFQSQAAGGPAGYALYLPPDYAAQPDSGRRYPVIYWLHGRGGDPRRGGTFVNMLDEAIRQGIAPPAIAVLVNGGPTSMYVDAADGSWPVESVIINDLIPHVDATYHTIPTREARCIEGQSMGGFGSARLGFKHPELFGAVSVSAGALIEPDQLAGINAPPAEAERRKRTFQRIWGGDSAAAAADSPWTMVRQNAEQIRGRTLIRLFIGDQDGLLDRNVRFHALLDELGITHEFTIVPGAEHAYDDKINRLGLPHFAYFAEAFRHIHAPAASAAS